MIIKSLILVFSLLPVVIFGQSPKLPPKQLSLETIMKKVERYIERHRVADVKAVFDFYLQLVSLPTKPDDCADGKYRGESIYDDYKYKHVVDLTIKKGEIIKIFYDEVKKGGASKRGDEKYCVEMKKMTGASPAEAYKFYEDRLLQTQDLMKIDALSGATYSLYRFRTAVIRAILNGLYPK